MINYILAFIISFVAVFFKVLQQKNVVKDSYKFMIPVSMGMALTQVLIIFLAIKEDIWVFIPMGVGGGIACIIAVKFHNKFF